MSMAGEQDGQIADGPLAQPGDLVLVLRRLLSNPAAVVALAVLSVIVLVAALAPFLPLQDPTAQNLALQGEPPSTEAWLGTDQLGRDILSRLIYGARVAFIVGFTSIAVGLLIGT